MVLELVFMCFFNDTMKYEEVYQYRNKGEIYLYTDDNRTVEYIGIYIGEPEVRFCIHNYIKEK